jgi:hypothetical integral membrane protein (TIGR02206 family)
VVPMLTPTDTSPDLSSWLHHFEPRSTFHLVTVLGCVAVMAAWCVTGKRLLLQSPEAERRFRVRVAWFLIAWQAFATIWRLLPENYTLEESIPLHLCRVVGWVVPFMLLTQSRRLRAVVYFWGLGLSTQGFFTPVWHDGFGHVGYWLFWMGHTCIVGAAAYDITVHGWGPRFRDWGFAALWGLIYAGLVIAFNLGLGTNYSYLGRDAYSASTIVDKLGDWPQRPLLMIFGAQFIMLLLYLAAVLVRRVKHTATSTEPENA